MSVMVATSRPELLFDFFAVEPIAGDLQRGWAQLHEGPEIFYTPLNGGHWVFTRADDIYEAWHDDTRFSHLGITLSREPRDMRFYPAEADPPEHARYRSLIQPFFSQRRVQAFEEQMRGLSRDLVQDILPHGECEFQGAFAKKMPIYIFLTIMDLPLEDAADLLPAADWLTRDPDPESFVRATTVMVEYLAGKLQERRTAPKDDFLTYLLQAEPEGAPLSEMEVLSITANVMFGGLDTVVSSMGFFMNYLARHPDKRRAIAEAPAIIPQATEELFRRHGITNFGRLVSEAHEVRGASLARGDFVLLSAALHNLDPRKYDDPLKVDFMRRGPSHLTFGTGIHRCIGAQLARLELRLMLQTWFQYIPDFELSDSQAAVLKSGRINAVWDLPLVWR